jgi:hypothetical protein
VDPERGSLFTSSEMIFKRFQTDSGPTLGRSDQDSQEVAKVFRWVRYHEIVHWRGRYPWNYKRRYSYLFMPSSFIGILKFLLFK